MREIVFVLPALALLAGTASAQTDWHPGSGHPTLKLWPSGAPGPDTANGPEHLLTGPKYHDMANRPVMRLANVKAPTITFYAAPAAHNSGAAVVVFPGGAYRYLAIDLEGTEVCAWLNSIGVNCVLLKYRVPNTGPYPKSVEALQDAQRAMGLVREHAEAWQIDSERIGVIGFSAGAYLAAALSTHFEERMYPAVDAADQFSCRPNFEMVIYPGYLSISEKNFEFNPAISVTADVPPTFLVQAEDDPVHVENVIKYFMKLKEAGVAAELHVYAQGGHGYGLRRTNLPITGWPTLADTWLHTTGVLRH
ncbi:MAG TPA: alpha/beta hydrolase [Acidobacteriaceae bacterium]|nr:alpha/beta hydrolase [Acidobacteriaceae bacterium]